MANGGPYPRLVVLGPGSMVTVDGGTLQAAQSGSWSVGLTGTLPAFAATPTFNLGTLNGAATAVGQAAIITALGLPFQVGGSIGNTAFGISGTLPAFAATPTVNVGTVQGYTPANIATSTTTTVKSGAGVLHGINVNTKGTIASTATVYDNTSASGTILAILDTLSLSGWNQFDVTFSTGLTIVTTGTSPSNITVSYR